MRGTLLLALAVATLAATPTLADRPTARSSGVQAIHTHPRSSSPTVGKLADQERVYLDKCTRQARWPRSWSLRSSSPSTPCTLSRTSPDTPIIGLSNKMQS